MPTKLQKFHQHCTHTPTFLWIEQETFIKIAILSVFFSPVLTCFEGTHKTQKAAAILTDNNRTQTSFIYNYKKKAYLNITTK